MTIRSSRIGRSTVQDRVMRSKQELDAAIRRDRRTVLVVNAHSRRGRRRYDAARRRLLAAGFHLLGAFPIDRPAELAASLADATNLGADLLVCGGGDGTIGTAARHLAHRDMALGLLPLGTTNNFARTLRIPLGLDAAIAVLTDGKVIDVDLGLASEMPFANHVGVGLSADIAAATPRWLKRIGGRLAYPLTALALLAQHRPVRAQITAGQRQYEFETHQLYVANGGFQAGRPITADTDADDKLLVAYPVGGGRRRDLLRATARNAATGHRRTLGEPPFVPVDQLWLHTDRPRPVEVDGELHGHTPLRVAVDPNALRVMATANTADR
jgi:YegS/Rv2252/BmrU family lipid kinase